MPFYNDNWNALAVAICCEKPLTVEAAFRVYWGESRGQDALSERTIDEIERLRKAGHRWRDINRMLCLRAADSYYRHYRLDQRRREREKANLRDGGDATVAAETPGNDCCICSGQNFKRGGDPIVSNV